MEIINSHIRRFLTAVSGLFCTSVLGWTLFLLFVEPPPLLGKWHQMAYTLIASTLCYWSARSMGYFEDPLRFVPRKSNLLILIGAAPLAACGTDLLSSIFHPVPVVPLHRALFWSPLIAVAILSANYFLRCLLVWCGEKKKIVIDVLPAEFHALTEVVEAYGISHTLEFISIEELRHCFRNGTEREVDLIVISHHSTRNFRHDGLLIRAHLAGIQTIDLKTLLSLFEGRVHLDDIDPCGYLLSARRQTPLLQLFRLIKVCGEPMVAIVLGILLSPLLAAIAILIKMGSPGPIFYVQERSGYLGKPFKLIKFRSMYTDAENGGPRWASHNDQRVTPIGRVLRKFRLDELPQLWNVLCGEMGFCGPRPERPEIAWKLSRAIPHFHLRTLIRPGITGWAQVHSGYAASVAESQIKLEFDLYYIQHLSPRIDLIILLKTIYVAFFGDQAEKRRRLLGTYEKKIEERIALKTT